MVEANGLDVMLGEFVGHVRSMTDVRVKPVEHKDNGYWLAASGVTKSGELDHFVVLVENMEVNKIFLWEYMFSLRIWL